MKKYIILGITSKMGGGQIYLSNKLQYLKEHHWDVCAIGCSDEVFLETLMPYKENYAEELWRYPWLFTRKKIRDVLDRLRQFAGDLSQCEEIVVESGEISYAFWGELFAKEIHAKHVVYLLSAFVTNIPKPYLDFFFFKLKQGTLACTSPSRAERMFEEYPPAREYPKKSLRAGCVPPLSKEMTPAVMRVKELGKFDYTIANSGRIAKPYVVQFVRECCQFAQEHKNKKFLLLMIGGDRDQRAEQLDELVEKTENVTIHYTGYLFPMPEQMFKLCDVIVGSSGSAFAFADIPTIFVTDGDVTPIGVMGYHGFTKKTEIQRFTDRSFPELLEDILIQKIYPNDSFEFTNVWADKDFIDQIYQKHMEFVEAAKDTDQYYDVLSIRRTRKQTVQYWLIRVFGLRRFTRFSRLRKNNQKR